MTEHPDTKRRIVERLKRVESATATDLAAEFGLTDTALRQHLDALEADGDGHPFDGRADRARTSTRALAAGDHGATDGFPDRHGELTVELLGVGACELGERALDQVIADRSDRQTAAYQQSLVDISDLGERVQRLADLRSDEGYLAEVRADDGAYFLIEHHCPIREAAAACGALCGAELDVFQRVLGPGGTVTRVQHVLAGDRRCAYRVEATAA